VVRDSTRDNGQERSALAHLIVSTHCLRVFETNLRSCNNQRLPEVTVHLSSQQVEVVRRHSHLGNLEVNVLRIQIVVRAVLVVSC
jgi:hypothetical protein